MRHIRLSAALSQMVWGPVAGQLAKQRLLIVADGALQYVPFSALPEPAAGSRDAGTSGAATNGQPLMVNHEIVSLPSASVTLLRRELKGRPQAERMVAVLADPVFDADDPRLKRARPRSESPETRAAAGQAREAVPSRRQAASTSAQAPQY